LFGAWLTRHPLWSGYERLVSVSLSISYFGRPEGSTDFPVASATWTPLTSTHALTAMVDNFGVEVVGEWQGQ
jgi:hypothetical protein